MPSLLKNPAVPAGILQGMHNLQAQQRQKDVDLMRMGQHPLQLQVRARQADAWLNSPYALELDDEDRQTTYEWMKEGIIDPAEVMKSQDEQRQFFQREQARRETDAQASQIRLNEADQKRQMEEQRIANKAKMNMAIASKIPGLSQARTWPEVQAILASGESMSTAIKHAASRASEMRKRQAGEAEARKRDGILQRALGLFSGREIPPEVNAAAQMYGAGAGTDSQLSSTVIDAFKPKGDQASGQGGGGAGAAPAGAPVTRSWKLSAAEQTADALLNTLPPQTLQRILEPIANPDSIDPASDEGRQAMTAAASMAGYVAKVSIDPALSYSEGMKIAQRLQGTAPTVTTGLRTRLIEWENNAWALLQRIDKDLPDYAYGAAVMQIAAALKLQPEEVIKAAEQGRMRAEAQQRRR